MIIFAGPTLDATDIRTALPEAEVRPPARTGDIYKACANTPVAIGLIDGYFEGIPAVWHKEILWALDHGIAVFGASSMGALRAAELHCFGMIGVGWIFEAFRDGRLEDDDEVALRHGPQALNYVALSEPMANIRATLDSSVSAGVLDPGTASDLCAMAKAMFFADRSWDALFAQAATEGLDPQVQAQFQSWLAEGRVDQKRIDALEMLAHMARFAPQLPQPAGFVFQHTAMWEDLKRQCDNAEPELADLLIIDQIRHDPERYPALRRQAYRALSKDAPADVPRAMLDRAITRLRTQHRLFTGAAFSAWLAENDLDLSKLRDRMREDLHITTLIVESPAAFRNALLVAVKEDPSFDALIRDAQTRAATLRSTGFDRPTPADLGLTPVTLLMWYFEVFRGQAPPDDLEEFLFAHDFSDRDTFEQMMARQFVLWQEQS